MSHLFPHLFLNSSPTTRPINLHLDRSAVSLTFRKNFPGIAHFTTGERSNICSTTCDILMGPSSSSVAVLSVCPNHPTQSPSANMREVTHRLSDAGQTFLSTSWRTSCGSPSVLKALAALFLLHLRVDTDTLVGKWLKE